MSTNNKLQQKNEPHLSPQLSETNTKFGYKVDDMDNVPSRYKCIFCSLIIRDPIQLIECGDRCCHGCGQVQVDSDSEGGILCPVEDCHVRTEKDKVCVLVRFIFAYE